MTLLLSAESWLGAIGRWLTYPSDPQPVEVIAVLGGGVERTDYALMLFEQGYAPELWHTGGDGDKARLLSLVDASHLPQAAITFLSSESTWQDAQVIIANAEQRGVRRILVVTSWFHSRRAMCSFRRQLVNREISIYFVAPPGGNRDNWWEDGARRRNVADELVKLGFYTLRYGLNPWGCQG